MQKQLTRILKTDFFLVIPILIVFFLYLPYINSLPYLDGNIDFVQSYDFYEGGLEKYFQNWNTLHPPFKLLLSFITFKIGGINIISYAAIGLIFSLLGIVAIYKLSAAILGVGTARITSILLATSPLYLSTGLFSLRDHLVTVLILLSWYTYQKNNLLLYALFSSAAVTTKETAILAPISLLIIELFYLIQKKTRGNISKKILLFTSLIFPLFLIFSWNQFLIINNKSVWSEWIFAETANKGTFYTIFNNMLTFQFLNQYAYQNWLQFLFLNFNWVYWIICLIGLTAIIPHIKLRTIFKFIIKGEKRIKIILTMILFSGGYFFIVLSFQTYTIPRYALPLLPILIIVTSFSLNILTARAYFLKVIFIALLSSTIFLSLFFSVDPLSIKIWGETEILEEKFYANHKHLAGNDGITYNIQYFFLTKKRSEKIIFANNQAIPRDCNWIFADWNNDAKTFKILGINNINLIKSCGLLR